MAFLCYKINVIFLIWKKVLVTTGSKILVKTQTSFLIKIYSNKESSKMPSKKNVSRIGAKFLGSLVFCAAILGVPSSLCAGNSSDITLEQASAIVAAAKAQAMKQGTLMNIAVVDAGANLKAFVRMDGAFLGSIDVSIKKAKSARLFNMTTKTLGELAQPGKSLYHIEFSNGGLIPFAGGIPLKNKEGEIIGAIGVSGSSVENDNEVAQAGAAVLAK